MKFLSTLFNVSISSNILQKQTRSTVVGAGKYLVATASSITRVEKFQAYEENLAHNNCFSNGMTSWGVTFI